MLHVKRTCARTSSVLSVCLCYCNGGGCGGGGGDNGDNGSSSSSRSCYWRRCTNYYQCDDYYCHTHTQCDYMRLNLGASTLALSRGFPVWCQLRERARTGESSGRLPVILLLLPVCSSCNLQHCWSRFHHHCSSAIRSCPARARARAHTHALNADLWTRLERTRLVRAPSAPLRAARCPMPDAGSSQRGQHSAQL